MSENEEAVQDLIATGFNEELAHRAQIRNEELAHQAQIRLEENLAKVERRTREALKTRADEYRQTARELFPAYSGCSESDFDQLAEHREKMDRYLTRQAARRAVPKFLLAVLLGFPFWPMAKSGGDLGVGIFSTLAVSVAAGSLAGALLGDLSGIAVGLGLVVVSAAIGIFGQRDWLSRDLRFLYCRARLKMFRAVPSRCLSAKS